MAVENIQVSIPNVNIPSPALSQKKEKSETEENPKINNQKIEEQVSLNTNKSSNADFVYQNTENVSKTLFNNDLEEILKKYPPETLRKNNFPADASLEIFIKTLSSCCSVIDTKKLEGNPSKLIDLMKNHPEYASQVREKLSEIYSPDDIVQICLSLASSAANKQPETNEPLGKSFRASRDGLQPASAGMAFGKTGWLENSGIKEAKDAMIVLANFSSLINIKKWEGEIVSGNVGLTAGGNLEFATVDGVAYAFTHFDGTFGPTGSVSIKLSDNNILKLSGEILHESTHLGDNAMEKGLHRHNDSAEWVGGEVSFQHINSPVEFEIYGGVDKYFHSMDTQPLIYKVEAGGVVSVLDRKLSLSGTVDALKADQSSKPNVVGDIEGIHTGGRLKLMYSPAGNGTGFTVSYDVGSDSLGQNIGQVNNRVIVGFQASDHIAEFFGRKK